ncbi:unnamed protein product [Taenia asiatica]|uniref:Peptidase A1 domain-containing protein n=1 Tax=Taenia asiatica TaxID=60517 RepID=A0A0R3VWV1_TAEAS|nr:unnamed protein product [Taenia asiatica]
MCVDSLGLIRPSSSFSKAVGGVFNPSDVIKIGTLPYTLEIDQIGLLRAERMITEATPVVGAYTLHKYCDGLAIYTTIVDIHNCGFYASGGKKLVVSPCVDAIISGVDSWGLRRIHAPCIGHLRVSCHSQLTLLSSLPHHKCIGAANTAGVPIPVSPKTRKD